MKPKAAGATLARYLNRGRVNGKVHSVFSSAVNVQVGDTMLLSLVSAEKGNAALSITFETEPELPDFWALDLMPGQAVALDASGLRLPDDRKVLSFKGATVWDDVLRPDGIRLGSPEEIRRASIQSLGEIWEKCVNPETHQVLDVLGGFRLGVSHDWAGRLVGLGPGLTPAGDDALAGIIAVLSLSQQCDWATRFRRDVMALAYDGTNLVSLNLLIQCGMGRPPEVLAQFIRSLLSASADSITSVRKLAGIGATSGCLMALGAILAAGIYQERRHAHEGLDGVWHSNRVQARRCAV